LYGYDLDTGKMLWNIRRRAPSLILHGQSGMVPFLSNNETVSNKNDETYLAVNFSGGRIMLLNSKTGSLEWESRVAFPKGVNEVERIIDLIGNPFIEDEEVCSTVYQTKIVCLSLQDGNINWSQDFTAIKPATFKTPYAIALDFSDVLVAFDRTSKKKIWENKDLLYRDLSAPKIWSDYVWVVDFKGFLHGLSLLTGRVESRLKIGSGKLAGQLLATEMGLLIQKENGNLLLIQNK
jgi:outer membrane protein assembly factor BamB